MVRLGTRLRRALERAEEPQEVRVDLVQLDAQLEVELHVDGELRSENSRARDRVLSLEEGEYSTDHLGLVPLRSEDQRYRRHQLAVGLIDDVGEDELLEVDVRARHRRQLAVRLLRTFTPGERIPRRGLLSRL